MDFHDTGRYGLFASARVAAASGGASSSREPILKAAEVLVAIGRDAVLWYHNNPIYVATSDVAWSDAWMAEVSGSFEPAYLLPA